MNKREIAEIKKQFKKDNNAITRICGCYVDAEKQIKTRLKEAFFALSEEEIFKYYEMFKKTLSGGIGKNLHNLEYSIHDARQAGFDKIVFIIKQSMEEAFRKLLPNGLLYNSWSSKSYKCSWLS